MKPVVAVCGKGGVGKTTISALLARLISEEKRLRGLIIDADPAGGLSLALSLPIKKTVNDLRKELIAATPERSSDSLNLAASIDYKLLDALTEKENLAFLAVGRPEEEGCYCQLNTFLRESIEVLANHFDFTVIDAEAGVEQVNRRVMREIHTLLLVSDPTAKGIRVAETISKVAEESMSYVRVGLMINRVEREEDALALSKNTPLELLGWLPEDKTIGKFDREGRSLLELNGSLSLKAMRDLATRLFGFGGDSHNK